MKMILIIMLGLISQISIASGKIVVVVSKDSDIEALDNQQVANIFLARTRMFPNGNKAVPIELKNNEIRNRFYNEISGKTASQLNAYWTTLVFTGKGKPPKSLSNSDKLILQLLDQPGAISYVLDNQVNEKMKVVYRFP